ncbi:MAG: hypothetical protein AB9866_16510 [Syntrophobacteraceae bacterium]
MKHACSTLALFIIIGSCLISLGNAAANSLSFRLLDGEFSIDAAIRPGLLIDKDKTDLFAKDNMIYVVNKSAILDETAIACSEMLGSSYSNDLSDTSKSRFQYSIKFDKSKISKLEDLSNSTIGKRLAIVFNKKFMIAPIIKERLSDCSISISGLSYSDANQLGYAMYKVCAWASNVSFRMVHPDNKRISEMPQLENSINLNEYEPLSMGDQKYWVSRKVQLGHNGFKEANILVDVHSPLTESQTSEVALESIPFTLNEEEEAARGVSLFKVRINLNEKGRDELKRLSGSNAGRELATVFEGKLLHIETIPEKTAPEFVLINYLTHNEAKRLRDAINRGSASREGLENRGYE